MACGTPLITTTGGALPEVVGPNGDAAFTVRTKGIPTPWPLRFSGACVSPELRARWCGGPCSGTKGFHMDSIAAEGCVEQYRAQLEERAAPEAAKSRKLSMLTVRYDQLGVEGWRPTARHGCGCGTSRVRSRARRCQVMRSTTDIDDHSQSRINPVRNGDRREAAADQGSSACVNGDALRLPIRQRYV